MNAWICVAVGVLLVFLAGPAETKEGDERPLIAAREGTLTRWLGGLARPILLQSLWSDLDLAWREGRHLDALRIARALEDAQPDEPRATLYRVRLIARDLAGRESNPARRVPEWAEALQILEAARARMGLSAELALEEMILCTETVFLTSWSAQKAFRARFGQSPAARALALGEASLQRFPGHRGLTLMVALAARLRALEVGLGDPKPDPAGAAALCQRAIALVSDDLKEAIPGRLLEATAAIWGALATGEVLAAGPALDRLGATIAPLASEPLGPQGREARAASLICLAVMAGAESVGQNAEPLAVLSLFTSLHTMRARCTGWQSEAGFPSEGDEAFAARLGRALDELLQRAPNLRESPRTEPR